MEVLENFYISFWLWLVSLEPWFKTSGIKILAIFFGAFIVRRFGKIIIEKIIRKLVPPDQFLTKEAEKKREDTLIRVFSGTIGVLVWVAASMMILSEFGIDIGPMLAAAGVVGLALGFGGQYLIRDVIAGLFIIIENQYRVGDTVEFDGTSGTVEDITLRTTILRDLDGVVHHIQNGSFSKSSNKSKSFSRINLDIGVSYNTKLDKVIKVIDKVGKEMAKSKEWKEILLEPPHFLRVENLSDSAVVLKIVGDVHPLERWSSTGELRRRLKEAFDKEKIEIPFPQIVVHKGK